MQSPLSRQLIKERENLVAVRLQRQRGRVLEVCDIVPDGTKIIVKHSNGKATKRRSIECWAGVSVPGKFKKLVAEMKAEGYRKVRGVVPGPKRVPPPVVEPVRGLPLIERCIEALAKRKRSAKPVSPAVARRMRLGRFPLPKTLERFVAFDLSFASTGMKDTGGLGKNRQAVRIVPTKLEVAIQAWLKACLGVRRPVNSLRSLAPDLPRGLYFQLPRLGDQMHFLFVGRASTEGEFPIIALDWEGVVADDGTIEGGLYPFLKYPSFDLYLADQLDVLGTSIDDVARMPGFKAEMRAALKANPELTL